jgi:hypothetical protein
MEATWFSAVLALYLLVKYVWGLKERFQWMNISSVLIVIAKKTGCRVPIL